MKEIPLAPARQKVYYGWIVLGAITASALFMFGIRLSFGVFFNSFEAEFGLTRTETSSMFSVYMLFSAVFGVVSGWALDRYGPKVVAGIMGLFTGLSLLATSQAQSLWQTYFTYSLLLGIGTGGTMPVVTALMSRWFMRRRGLALGIATSSVGLGTLLIAPLSASLISAFQWRLAFIILGVITLVITLSAAMLLKRDPREVGALPDGQPQTEENSLSRYAEAAPKGLTVAGALRTRSFWFLAGSWVAFAFFMNLILTHVVPDMTDRGLSNIEAATVLSVASAFLVLSRMSMGHISDRVGTRLPCLVSAVVGAVAVVVLISAHAAWMFYLFGVLVGVAWGGIGVTMVRIPADVFGQRKLGSVMGTLEVSFSLGGAAGAAAGGLVYDLTKSYAVAFIIGIAALIISVILMRFTKKEYQE